MQVAYLLDVHPPNAGPMKLRYLRSTKNGKLVAVECTHADGEVERVSVKPASKHSEINSQQIHSLIRYCR
jgi:hypothetical protein